jgi:hypothetical protein
MSSGCFLPVDDWAVVLADAMARSREIVPLLHLFKEKRKQRWDLFCQRVHEYARSGPPSGALAIQYIRKAISVDVVFSDDADMLEH